MFSLFTSTTPTPVTAHEMKQVPDQDLPLDEYEIKSSSVSISPGQEALATMTTLSHYARAKSSTGELESWDDIADRVFTMHRKHVGTLGRSPQQVAKLRELLDAASQAVKDKIVFPSGRSMQYAGTSIERNHARMFNCTATNVTDIDAFAETFYLLLCGCGVGLSVQHHHVDQLPVVTRPFVGAVKMVYTIEDSIEGWASAVKVLFASFDMRKDMTTFGDYVGKHVVFDYSQIRPKGAAISDILGTAPGPDPLRKSLVAVHALLSAHPDGTRLRPIDVFDVVGQLADAVLAGGVRRSAMIVLFDPNDEDMSTSKTGHWYSTAPWRARANISAIVLKSEVTKPMIAKMIKNAKAFGEPGIIMTDNLEDCINPCSEVGLRPYIDVTDEKTGVTTTERCFDFCNLCDLNVTKCTTPDEFMTAVTHAAVIASVQASYTSLPYITSYAVARLKASALIGVSLTGITQNVELLRTPGLLTRGAKQVIKVNEEVAALLGTTPSERSTTVKPSGTASCVLGLGGAGIHPSHAIKYLRRVQISDDDEIGTHYADSRPRSREKSVWSASTDVITFPIELSNCEALTKQNTSATELLDLAKFVQKEWVLPGTRDELVTARNNVSLTVNVEPDEWDAVGDAIYDGRQVFTGVSLLGDSGDTDYQQAPYERVMSARELVTEFGIASFFASGMIVDLVSAFGSLHKACSANEFGIPTIDVKTAGHDAVAEHDAKSRASGRITKFAKKYFGGDDGRARLCLKRVNSVYVYETLSRESESNSVDWSTLTVTVTEHSSKQATKRQTVTCSGGACELKRL
jgi:ribonucleoside-diphosphate reductase alpha chain